jgi:hypothetical protein
MISVRLDEENGVHDYALLRLTGLSDRLRGTGEDVENLGALCFERLPDMTKALADAVRTT